MRSKLALYGVVLGLIFAGYFFLIKPHAELMAGLNNSRAAIAKQTQDLEAQVDETLTNGWRDFAERDLSDYQLGRIDEKMDSIGDRHSQWNHRNVTTEIYSAIFETVQEQLIQEGDYPVTVGKVRERIRRHPQGELLSQLSLESRDLPLLRGDALVATDLEQCAQLQKKLEEQRQILLPLLAKVSRW